MDNNSSTPIRGLTARGQALVNNIKSDRLSFLKSIPEYAILSPEDARELYKMKEKEAILSKYTFPEHAGKDGYLRIWVKDATKKSGRKQLSAKSHEELADKVYQFEKGLAGSSRKTFRDVFFIVQAEKVKYIKDPEKLLSVQNTVSKNKCDYKRFFQDTAFEKMFIDEITKKDIENIVYSNLQKYSLRKKAFSALKGILRSTFALAFEEYWISDNVYLRANFDKYNGMLIPEISIEKRIHSTNDVSRIIDYLHVHQQRKPNYLPAYALEMQIIMGMRRGEIPPMSWDCITDSLVFITKEQITVKRNESNAKEYDVIVHHTKNYTDRSFPRTNALDNLLERIKIVHEKYYPDSQYLFPANSNTGVITNKTVYNFYRRVLKKLDIKVDPEIIKGPHSFRRNAITDFVNETNGNIVLASQIFGNSPQVARKNYLTTLDLTSAADALNKRKLS